MPGIAVDAKNLPIQVIAHCDAEGGLRPLRFQYEDRCHRLHTVHVEQITDTRQVDFVGIEALLYLCKARIDGREHLYELKYTIRTHKWTLFRQIY